MERWRVANPTTFSDQASLSRPSSTVDARGAKVISDKVPTVEALLVSLNLAGAGIPSEVIEKL